MHKLFNVSLITLLICFLQLTPQHLFAGVEPYQNFIKGKLQKNDSLVVKDEKFRNASFNWNDITNISVTNNITLRIIDDVLISKSFSCNLTLKILYFSGPDQSDTLVIDTVKLRVNYLKDAGKPYKVSDNFNFKNGHYVKIYITDINSPEFGNEMPPVLQLTSSITVDRKYKFVPEFPIRPTITVNKLVAQFDVVWAQVQGAEEYDLEWATVDSGSEFEALTLSMKSNSSLFNWEIDKLFRNNATRVTTQANSYRLSVLYNSDYLVLRIRQVQYDSTGLRLEGEWDYKQTNDSYAVYAIDWNESNLNWQSSAVYAEEGKKKEVVSYFDGTLRGRQTVTINNSDNIAVVQENIFDEFGRPIANILPTPVYESGSTLYLHYFKNLNVNASNTPYNFKDLADACEVTPSPLSTVSGTSRYYSSRNEFLADPRYQKNYNSYIPDAAGFPLSVTQYTSDNTGRIKIQGGVGAAFQPGGSDSKVARYYYGKPEQWELDRLFGNDVGFANHYLKNMVVDPNGQISISYLNASGKTIATALTGSGPDSQDKLSSNSPVKTENIHLLSPAGFVFNGSDLKLTATTTYLSSVKDTASFSYDIQKLVDSYPGGDFKRCGNCYYDLTIKVLDDCNTPVYTTEESIKIGSDSSNCNDVGLHEGSFRVPFPKIGEYYVTFEFALNRDVIEDYTDNFISEGSRTGHLDQEFKFVFNRLKQTDFSGVFSDCKTCLELLGAKTTFAEKMTAKLTELEASPSSDDETEYNKWLSELYDKLKGDCITLQDNCIGSPCDEAVQLMLTDVSPQGQYALFDEEGNVLEPELNVLANYWKIEFPVAAAGSSIFNSELITEEDGSTTSPYAESFFPKKVLKYWKEEWAIKFLKYHPEICKLQFCQKNSSYLAWDEKVKEKILAASEIPLISPGTNLKYEHAVSEWLLSADPFFQVGAPGAAYYRFMQADLQQYSKNVLKNGEAPNKSLTQLVDFLLYCSNLTGGVNNTNNSNDNWSNCEPIDNCRVPDREWQLYKDMYFEVKEAYLARMRESECGSVCEVGSPYSLLPPNTYSTGDFHIESIFQDEDSSCGQNQLQIQVTYLPGRIKNKATVEIYHPGQSAPLVIEFFEGDSSKVICVQKTLPLGSIRVSNVIQ